MSYVRADTGSRQWSHLHVASPSGFRVSVPYCFYNKCLSIQWLPIAWVYYFTVLHLEVSTFISNFTFVNFQNFSYWRRVVREIQRQVLIKQGKLSGKDYHR